MTPRERRLYNQAKIEALCLRLLEAEHQELYNRLSKQRERVRTFQAKYEEVVRERFAAKVKKSPAKVRTPNIHRDSNRRRAHRGKTLPEKMAQQLLEAFMKEFTYLPPSRRKEAHK